MYKIIVHPDMLIYRYLMKEEASNRGCILTIFSIKYLSIFSCKRGRLQQRRQVSFVYILFCCEAAFILMFDLSHFLVVHFFNR